MAEDVVFDSPCDGTAHRWHVLNEDERDRLHPGWKRAAIAECCGVHARHDGFEWVIDQAD